MPALDPGGIPDLSDGDYELGLAIFEINYTIPNVNRITNFISLKMQKLQFSKVHF